MKGSIHNISHRSRVVVLMPYINFTCLFFTIQKVATEKFKMVTCDPHILLNSTACKALHPLAAKPWLDSSVRVPTE